MVIYGDVFFLMDFCADVLLLEAVHTFTGRHLTAPRCLLGAFAGAFGDVLLVVWQVPSFVSVPFSFLISGLMLFASFGTCGGAWLFGRTLGLLWCAGLLSGGITTVLAVRLSADTKRAGLFICCVVGLVSVLFLFRLLKRQTKQRQVSLSVVIDGKKIETDALCDTGNLVTEPVSGLPVVFLAEQFGHLLIHEPYLSDLDIREDEFLPPFACFRRLMPIRISGVSGTSLVWGIRADLIQITAGEISSDFDGYIVFRKGRKPFGGMGAVVPASAVPF